MYILQSLASIVNCSQRQCWVSADEAQNRSIFGIKILLELIGNCIIKILCLGEICPKLNTAVACILARRFSNCRYPVASYFYCLRCNSSSCLFLHNSRSCDRVAEHNFKSLKERKHILLVGCFSWAYSLAFAKARASFYTRKQLKNWCVIALVLEKE